jgi:hypothetical protein
MSLALVASQRLLMLLIVTSSAEGSWWLDLRLLLLAVVVAACLQLLRTVAAAAAAAAAEDTADVVFRFAACCLHSCIELNFVTFTLRLPLLLTETSCVGSCFVSAAAAAAKGVWL